MSKKFKEILSKAKYKEGTKKYKDEIKANNSKTINTVHTELKGVLNDPSTEPYTLLYATRLLKDCVAIGNPLF